MPQDQSTLPWHTFGEYAGVVGSTHPHPFLLSGPVISDHRTHPRAYADGATMYELSPETYDPRGTPLNYTVSIYVRNKLSHIQRSISYIQALSIGRVLAESDRTVECVVHDGQRRTVERIRASAAPVAVAGGI